MAVQAGWVGTSAKAETGKAWMGEARLALRLPKAGWMSEMIGMSTKILYVNTADLTEANIYELIGSPTTATVCIFENTATITAATQGGWALQAGDFPAGSSLTIINRGYIRAGGGNSTDMVGQKGGDAILLNLPSQIDNSEGYIYAGGGGGGSLEWPGGGGVALFSGGGGAGVPAGLAAVGRVSSGGNGTATTGGKGSSILQSFPGRGGDLGEAGVNSHNAMGFQHAGGAAGRAVVMGGHALTWLGGNDTTRVKGAVE